MHQQDPTSLYLLAERLAKPEHFSAMVECLRRVGTRPEEIEYARRWAVYSHLFRSAPYEQETR